MRVTDDNDEEMLVKKTCHLREKHVGEFIDDDNNEECFKGEGKVGEGL